MENSVINVVPMTCGKHAIIICTWKSFTYFLLRHDGQVHLVDWRIAQRIDRYIKCITIYLFHAAGLSDIKIQCIPVIFRSCI